MEIILHPEHLRPGDLMFGPIHGLTGIGVGLAQLLLAVAEPGMIWRQGPGKWFRIRHCGIITEEARLAKRPQPGLPAGAASEAPKLVQAMPGGIEEIYLDSSKWNKEYVYIRPAYEFGQDLRVAAAARSYVGRPYDFATYGAIPLYRRGIRTKRIEQIISDTSSMMCSRTVDAALCEGGWHLFSDGRLPGNVTPSEVYRRLLQMPMRAISDLSGIKP